MAERTMQLAVALNGYGLTFEERGARVRQVVPWRDLLQIVETVEETGYEAVFTPEIAAREAFSTLAGFAGATTRLRLATGVVRMDRRDVQTTALAAATIDDLSAGRFVLGLGSSGAIEEARRFLRDVREALLGRDVVEDGPGGQTDVAGLDHPAPGVPVFLAALGPRMTELAGEAADGVLLNWCTPERVVRARQEVARGAERAGRDPGRVAVAVYVRACLGHDRAHALTALREVAGQYAAMPKYRRQFEAMGLGNEAEAAGRPTGGPGWDHVPRGLVETVCLLGTREQAQERLAAFHQAGADLVVVYPVPAQEAVSSIMGTVLAVAPDPAVEH
ncbi:MAG: LLM class flavin-dependent oxidoreductase [Actinomycetota bacterium]